MKNLVLLGLAAFALYLYMHPRQEPVEAPPVVVQVPTPAPKMYYHSPLDAGAMPTNYSTGTGYYSSDPTTSRFNNIHSNARSSSVAGGYPVYSGGTTVNNTTVYSGSGSRSTATSQPQSQSASVSNRRPNYPANSYGRPSSLDNP